MTADKYTEKELNALERRIKREYKSASQQLQDRADLYFKKLADRYEKEHDAYLHGAYTDAQFKNWYISQIGRGRHWENLKKQMAQRLTDASIVCQDMINGKLPKIYLTNYKEVGNIAQKSALKEGILGVRFDLVDEYVVKSLMQDSSEVKPFQEVAINLPRQYTWNLNKLQNALLQGVLQGDSIDHIAYRFQSVTGMNQEQAIRNARTSVTGVQNKAKQDRFDDLASKGCIMTKTWINVVDGRTRDAHIQAGYDYGTDAKAIPYDEPFIVMGEKLMHPCDKSGSPSNIYNCRCSMGVGDIKFKSILTDEQRKKANIRVK